MADNNKDLSYEQLIALEEPELTKTVQGIYKNKTLKKEIIDKCFSNLLQNKNFHKNCILLTESIISCKHEKGSFNKKDFNKLFIYLKTNIEEYKKKEKENNNKEKDNDKHDKDNLEILIQLKFLIILLLLNDDKENENELIEILLENIKYLNEKNVSNLFI